MPELRDVREEVASQLRERDRAQLAGLSERFWGAGENEGILNRLVRSRGVEAREDAVEILRDALNLASPDPELYREFWHGRDLISLETDPVYQGVDIPGIEREAMAMVITQIPMSRVRMQNDTHLMENLQRAGEIVSGRAGTFQNNTERRRFLWQVLEANDIQEALNSLPPVPADAMGIAIQMARQDSIARRINLIAAASEIARAEDCTVMDVLTRASEGNVFDVPADVRNAIGLTGPDAGRCTLTRLGNQIEVGVRERLVGKTGAPPTSRLANKQPRP